VLDHAGHPAAGLALTFPADKVPAAARDGLARRLRATADELTRRIGGRP